MSGPARRTPASLTSATATTNAKARPAAQPQATVIAIHRASRTAMIAPRPHTALEVCPPPVRFASRIANPGSVGGQHVTAMPTRLKLRMADAAFLAKDADQ